MNDFNYEYPETLTLDDGETVVLDKEEMKDERMLAIVIPREKVWSFASFLYDRGFSEATPAWNQGEEFGLSRIIDDPWEIHIRIYRNGRIFPHVEVRRDYFQHLDEKYIWPVYYEAMKYVDEFTDEHGLFYLKTKKWVTGIVTKAKSRLIGPDGLTEWKPVVSFVSGLAAGALLVYGLSKLFESLAEPPRMIAKLPVRKSSDSLFVEIPKDVAEKIGIEEGGELGLYEQKGTISVKKV